MWYGFQMLLIHVHVSFKTWVYFVMAINCLVIYHYFLKLNSIIVVRTNCVSDQWCFGSMVCWTNGVSE